MTATTHNLKGVSADTLAVILPAARRPSDTIMRRLPACLPQSCTGQKPCLKLVHGRLVLVALSCGLFFGVRTGGLSRTL